MKRENQACWLIAVGQLLCCFAFVTPLSASADELTRNANASFALTIVDMATTRLSIAHTNGAESNPFARPFVRSDIGALGYAVVVTAIERLTFHSHPKAFVAVDGAETYSIVHNYMSRLHALDVTRAEELARAQR